MKDSLPLTTKVVFGSPRRVSSNQQFAVYVNEAWGGTFTPRDDMRTAVEISIETYLTRLEAIWRAKPRFTP